jgi:hypothetical protein
MSPLHREDESPSLSEIIDQRVISKASFIEPTRDLLPVAIDTVGRFAVVYWLGIEEQGEWVEECSIALRTGDTWSETTRGGGHGEGWETPWRPPSDGWNGRALVVGGSSGMDLPNDGDQMVLVRGVYGFVSEQVRAIRSTQGGASRVVDVASPVGAFVVLLIGEDSAELQGLDSDGQAIGQATIPR